MTTQLNNFIAISSEAIRNRSSVMKEKSCFHATSFGGNERSCSSVMKEKSCFHATSFGGNERSCPTAIKRENQKKPRGCF